MRSMTMQDAELLIDNLVAATLAEEHEAVLMADDEGMEYVHDRFLRAKEALLRALAIPPETPPVPSDMEWRSFDEWAKTRGVDPGLTKEAYREVWNEARRAKPRSLERSPEGKALTKKTRTLLCLFGHLWSWADESDVRAGLVCRRCGRSGHSFI